MTLEKAPEMHLIDVVVQSDPSGFLVATSRQLPKLLAVATCEIELASELPEHICRACEASFGQSCRAFAVRAGDTRDGVWRCERWAIVPS